MIVSFNIQGEVVEKAEIIPGRLYFYLVDKVIGQGLESEKHLWSVYHEFGTGYGQRLFSSNFPGDEARAREWLQKQIECKAMYQSLQAKKDALEKRMAPLQNKLQAVNQQIHSLLTMG